MNLDMKMGSQVIAHLEKRFGVLPAVDGGFVGGQAVASALSELYGDGTGIAYNDLDIFRPSVVYDGTNSVFTRRKEVDAGRQFIALGTTFDVLAVDHDIYGELVWTRPVGYSVTATSRNGDLNLIDCNLAVYNPTNENDLGVSRAIQSFDINSCQVGVNLANGHLLWSPEFERFTRSKQLAITNLRTPAASLIRYFRKRKQLEGLTGNDERMLEMVALAWSVHQHFMSDDACWEFGRDFEKKLQEVASDILPHFDVIKVPSRSFRTDEHAYRKDNLVNTLKPKFDVPAAQFDAACKFGMHCAPSLVPKISYVYGEHHDTATREKMIGVLGTVQAPSPFFMAWNSEGESIFPEDVTREELVGIGELLTFSGFSPYLFDTPIGEAVRRLRWITQEVKSYGHWIHSLASDLWHLADKAEMETEALLEAWMANPTLFKSEADAYAQKYGMPLVEPVLKGKAQIGNFSVRELTTALELQAAGARTRHPVGAYSSALSESSTRVFLFENIYDSEDVIVGRYYISYQDSLAVDFRLRYISTQGWDNSNDCARLDKKDIDDFLLAKVRYAYTAAHAPKSLQMLMLDEATPCSIKDYTESVANRLRWIKWKVENTRRFSRWQQYSDDIPF